MKAVFWLSMLVLSGYVGVKAAMLYNAKTDFASRVEYRLDFVDEASIDSVKQDLVHEAQNFGIQLVPENIQVLYEDTERRTVAQQIEGNRIAGTQFTNKQITIHVHYAIRILGIPIGQEITRTKIKQVQAPLHQPGPEMRQLLDENK
jgi:hypothetical protein